MKRALTSSPLARLAGRVALARLADLALLAALAAFAVSGCGDAAGTEATDLGGDEADTDATASPPDAALDATDPDAARWHVVLRDLPAALLSIAGAGPDDLWLTGGDRHDGTGPWVIRGVNGAFTRVDLRAADPEGGPIWWSAAPDASAVFLVGEGGRAFFWDRATETVERLPTGTDATLFGVWGASSDALWAVGGFVYPRTGPPTVVRFTAGVGQVVADLPAELDPDVTLFKVWGSAPDDVWVVGERGTVLHWDGARWQLTRLPGAPRLVTLHGAGPDDLVVVGGAAQAVLFERGADATWRDASPGPSALLNGVYVAPGGDAFAVGMLGQTFRRTAGVWTGSVELPLLEDWHAAWIDARGDAWIVGGNLLSAATFDAGALLRFGPARDDLPAGPVAPLTPTAEPDADDVVEAREDLSEPSPEVVDPADTADALVDIGPIDTVDTGDTAAPVDAAPDAWLDPELEIGALTGATAFTAFTAGQAVEIVQGPQGGVHVEIALRYPFASVEDPLVTGIDAHTTIAGEAVGAFTTVGYPTPRLAPGLYQTYTLPVVFVGFDASPYTGRTAVLSVTITLPGGAQRSATVAVLLRDDF